MSEWSQALSAFERGPDAASHGNRGLQIEELLLFERDAPGRCGVDLPEPPAVKDRLGGLRRSGPIGLPGLSEPQVVRHFTRLSQKNYAIDTGLYPLGSCTMKHNPRLNEKLARLSGFADLHPLQPMSTVQGALELIDTLANWLKTLTGMPAVAMSPAAGAHGELCGMLCIRAALDARGRVDLDAIKAKLGPDVSALMLTNPNTCGLFEDEMIAIGEAVHAAGAYFYCDGANFNAIVGRVRPADLGIDCMHINLHKTFSTPHGGGGPGAGPVVLAASLAPFAPLPWVVHAKDGFRLLEQAEGEAAQAFGRLKGNHGQMGRFVRALAYMMTQGSDGLRQVSGDAVLNANYLLASLRDVLTASFPGPTMHEVLFDDHFLRDTGVTTLDFAKALIDEGYHPMTMYFPLVVHGALLMEPTETESKETLDRFIAVVKELARRAKAGDGASFHAAPRFTPRRRLDETAAARKPVLRWQPENAKSEAAD
ncbi:MAG TPA: glycine dehydrogenase subunit 2 [Stellaceae bacterium]|nr:glycine dehydrogenase subunit 2 [Stellaceae bacterium]